VPRCSLAAQGKSTEVLMNGNGGEVSSFLTKLGEDSQLRDAYSRDPEGAMREAGLSDDSIQTLLSRDLEKVKAVLDKELAGGDYMLFMVIFGPKA
jgi:hypothetical protein